MTTDSVSQLQKIQPAAGRRVEAAPHDAVSAMAVQGKMHAPASESARVTQLHALRHQVDRSPQVRQLKALQLQVNDAAPIQRYAIGPSTTQTVTVQGNTKTKSFQQCVFNSVEYNKGDPKVQGTPTKTPAAWAGWLVNQNGGHNATQLHVVNQRWGGRGGPNDGNIVPGSPAENSHHLHQGEKIFDDICFGGNKSIAQRDAKYECWASPNYSGSVDVRAGAKKVADPTITVRITSPGLAPTVGKISPGGGLEFRDGS